MNSIARLLIHSAALLVAMPAFAAELQDAPAVDVNQLLQALRGIKDQQALQLKSARQKALQQVQAAAATPAAAVAAWEEAVRTTQFEGAAREGSQFKEWREREGEALKEKEAANAAQLHFKWMALTLQRSIGTPVKDLLPQVIAFTKELANDQAAIEALEEGIKREKEMAASGKHGKDHKTNDEAVKRMHDQIIRSPVNGSVAAQVLKIADLVTVEKWEMNAGSLDGIYGQIILPELRANKDPRLLEYWDMRLKRESENATKSKLAFDIEKFNQVRRPELLWSRAQDVLRLGQRNRALGEMFNLVKTFPNHPGAREWVTTIEKIIVPPALAAPTAPVSAADAPLAPPPADP